MLQCACVAYHRPGVFLLTDGLLGPPAGVVAFSLCTWVFFDKTAGVIAAPCCPCQVPSDANIIMSVLEDERAATMQVTVSPPSLTEDLAEGSHKGALHKVSN